MKLTKFSPKQLMRASLLAALMTVGACGSDTDGRSTLSPGSGVTPPATVSFNVTITNLTNAQPISPVAALIHRDGFNSIVIGEGAGLGVEMIAEAGSNGEFLNEVRDLSTTIASMSGSGPIGPGASETIRFGIFESDIAGAQLSVIGMLVNTNDAITALNAIGIDDIAVGETRSYDTIAYDAGTEDDTEAAGTIPGPADGGEGFNAERSDGANVVTMHQGVVSRDDGLVSSVLTQAHRFDNPVARISLTRL